MKFNGDGGLPPFSPVRGFIMERTIYYHPESFPILIRELRRGERLTQAEFAVKIGVKQQTVSLVEKGQTPTVDYLVRVGRTFGVKFIIGGLDEC